MKGLGLLLSITGFILLMVFCYLFFDHVQFLSRAKETTGEVVRVDIVKGDEGDSYIPVVKFKSELQGEIVTKPNVTLSPPYGKNDFIVGEKIQVFYDSKNPGKIFLKPFFENWGLTLILGALGIALLSAGLIIVFIIQKRKRIAEWLVDHGKKIKADFDLVDLNYGTTKNDIHPFIIVCTWKDIQTNEEYRFISSEDIWVDPTSYIPNDKKIEVWIDPGRPGDRYKIDLSFIPQGIES